MRKGISTLKANLKGKPRINKIKELELMQGTISITTSRGDAVFLAQN